MDNKGHVEEEKSKLTSMSTLIIWNISKALEKNPRIELKCAIKAAQERMERDSPDLNSIISEYSEERHLACALLAWQQLGHNDADSLYQFVETKRHERSAELNKANTLEKSSCPKSLFCGECRHSKDAPLSSFGRSPMGPVVKLPLETKIVMRMENTPSVRRNSKRQHFPKEHDTERDTVKKIDAACCLESVCIERLAAVDAATTELRTRAGRLARREAERVELLERAETAWKDLELGYQRRLNLAEEKEEDMTRQIHTSIEDRNGFKNACITLMQQLKAKGEIAEKERARLTQVEKEVCERACLRMHLSEESAQGDTTLTDHQCKAVQLDRDLQFKEEQARRKMLSLDSEVEGARVLALEAERAMRAELGTLREQIEQVSKQLLEEDALNGLLRKELDESREEKMDMIEDLEGCKLMCDNRMQGKIDELTNKKEHLAELKDKLMECRCKIPVDITVEAKRTPSLAALCRCTPEEKLLESCSCTSLRSKLLSDLLADLFGGLQAELSGSGLQMPCQLLKCLEDKHNWDRASIAKTNLRNFFAQLLIGELDIAIATSIEKYHAKWVGASCADQARLIPDPGEVENEGWQERALERRAQKLATKLAERLFQERAERLVQQAKDIVTAGPPPCECNPGPAVYSCLVNAGGAGSGSTMDSGARTPAYWRRTHQDVTQLRIQIEDLKKDSVKKEDLMLMEQNLTKIVQRTSGPDNDEVNDVTSDRCNETAESTNKKEKSFRATYQPIYSANHNKSAIIKKKQIDTNGYIKKGNKNSFNPNIQLDKSSKSYKKTGQSYAVNLCICSAQTDSNKVTQQGKVLQNTLPSNEGKTSWKHKTSKDTVPDISSIKQTKPINSNIPSKEVIAMGSSKIATQPMCQNKCICFHKPPSNTSINKLLETLAKWKGDLTELDEKREKEKENNTLTTTRSQLNNMHDIQSKEHLNGETKDSKRTEKKSDCEKSLHISNQCCNVYNEVNTNSGGLENLIPATTESEYMGAINLEKSQEDFCKCLKQYYIKRQENARQDLTASNYPFKCINSAECSCGKSYEISNEESKNQHNPDTANHTSYNNKQNVPQDKEETPKFVSTIEDFGNIEMSNNNYKDINGKYYSNKMAKTEAFPCDCDYYIKYIGVTLTKAISEKEFEKSSKQNNSNGLDNEGYSQNNNEKMNRSNKLYDNKYEASNKDSKSKPSIKLEEIKRFDRQGNKKLINDDRNYVKFDESKSFTNDNFEKQVINVDKSLDAQIFEDNINKQDSCAYCKRFDLSYSNDLEVNAFNLLEEHLKRKLEDFKLSSSNPSSIPADVEENLFATILQKVKQVIADSTNQITCRCSSQQKITEGSWNRAYGLLQEYLKMKVKRVQCLCLSSKDNTNVALPEVLDKISNLIENDFQRLKSTCKMDDITYKNMNNNNNTYFKREIPEKDTNSNKTSPSLYSDENTVPANLDCKRNSKKSIFITQNISSQVPSSLGMANKSCNAMEKYTKNVQTSEPGNENILHAKKCCINTELKTDCNCDSKENAVPFFELLGNNEVIVSHCIDVTQNNICKVPVNIIESKSLLNSKDYIAPLFGTEQHMEENKTCEADDGETPSNPAQISNLPYIGYTIDCSCDFNLGACVCSKSIVQANNYKINNNWKAFVAHNNNNPYLHKLSYIMNSKPNANINDNIDLFHDLYLQNILDANYLKENDKQICEEQVDHDKVDNSFQANRSKTNEKQICETEVNVQNEEEINLKASNINMNMGTKNSTNATDTLIDQLDDDHLDCYECGSPINKSQPNVKIDHAIQHSTYFPISSKNDGNTETNMDNVAINLNLLPQNCECDVVPICHVKMLVENIENKLVRSMCTCDSLIPKVCPVHSMRNKL